MKRKRAVCLAMLIILLALLFTQAFVFPIIDMAIFYVLFTIEQHSAPKELDCTILNKDDAAHVVSIEVSEIETNKIIYKANHTLQPGKMVSKRIAKGEGKYRVKAVLDGKITKEREICLGSFGGSIVVIIDRHDGKLDFQITQGTF